MVFGVPALIVTAAVVYWPHPGQPHTSVAPTALDSPDDNAAMVLSAQQREALPAEFSDWDLAELLENPRVQTYLQRERDKQALVDYFSGEDESLGDEEVRQLIESIESDGRVMAYEGLALKLAWLERNSSSKTEFDRRAQELVRQYRERSEQSAREYDPYEEVPGFAQYKVLEQEIIRQAQSMESFPNGMSQQEYLRKRLQEARETAYAD